MMNAFSLIPKGFIGPPGVAGPPGLEGEKVSSNISAH